MSDSINHPQPGESSTEGAYSRDPQNPTYYFQDSNQYGTVNAAPTAQYSTQTAAQTAPVPTDSSMASWVNFTSTDYLKGLALGAGVALVVTNPTVQKTVVSGAVKMWAALQGGVEELKEQVQDAKAEISQQD
ncbi:YtxH domain-containing protein [Pseudodesulfovibrio sp. JC047]|uniref:YtxH domain-containing protein n=1 Tax=Pseudodesulfovibrio sp. JC047 TaxID=2683199 RepID=UPI0013D1D01F|nr:YtxH domain-containing protein [Pseudodesulfovibrio sp. JC047]NDV18415.1 YtxH domain-containing protein [Pseudodesulfovibrio sp. JC047]